GIRLTAQVDDGRDAGDADRDVGEAGSPRAAEGVGHDDADRRARAGPDDVAYAAGGTVGVEGQQRGLPGIDVGEVHTGVRAHEAVRGLADDQVAAAAQHAYRFGFDECSARRHVVRIE